MERRAPSNNEVRLARQLQRVRFGDDRRGIATKWVRMRERLTGNTGLFGSRLLKHRHLIYAASFGPVTEGSGETLRYNTLGVFLKLPERDLHLWEGCEAAKYGVTTQELGDRLIGFKSELKLAGFPMEDVDIVAIASIVGDMPKTLSNLLRLESGFRNKLSDHDLRFRYHAGGHPQTLDVHMRSATILDNAVLVPAAANPITFTDEEIWGVQGRQVEDLLNWSGTRNIVLTADEVDEVLVDTAAVRIRSADDEAAAVFPEIDPEGWYAATGTPFSGQISVYSEKFEFFRYDPNSEEFYDLVKEYWQELLVRRKAARDRSVLQILRERVIRRAAARRRR